MNKLTWIVGIIVFLLIGAGIAYALTYNYPNSAIIGEVEYTVYIDDIEWTGGTTVDWNIIYPGNTYYYNLTVESLVPSNTTVYLTVTNLPQYWNLTWNCNATLILPQQSVWGYMNLTIPSNATAGSYGWFTDIKGEYT